MSENEVRAAFDAAETITTVADQGEPYPAPDFDEAGDYGQYGGDMPEGADDGPPIGPHDLDPEAAEAIGATFPLNDFGNGQRLVHYYGENILFVPRLGWYRWGDRRWRTDEDELDVRRDAQKLSAHILAEIPHIALEDWQTDALNMWLETRDDFKKLSKQKELTETEAERLAELREIASSGERIATMLGKVKTAHRGHAKNTGNTSKISNALLEAKVAAATTVGALNADPLMLNCESGVIHFTNEVDAHDAAFGDTAPKWRATLLPHMREQMISKMATASYDPKPGFDPEKDCPVFMAFLRTIQPDPEMRGFLQRWFGYSITGLISEQKLAFLYGGGSNGKSTLVEIVARIMDDYGSSIPIETLTGSEQRKGSDATPDLVRLPGARFVRASEPEQGQRMKEALIKALTGGEPIMIRRMQQEFVEIMPEFKLTISGNHKPEVRGADDGIWRRILLIPFTEQIADADKDKALPEKLWAERDAILAWLVAGCLDWLSGGLREPITVLDATEEYRRDSDPYRVFLENECKITGNPEHFVRGRTLTDAFNAWLLHTGLSAFGKRTVANAFKAREGVMKSKDGHVYSWGKRSDTGYLGLQISKEAGERIADYSGELLSAGQRRG